MRDKIGIVYFGKPAGMKPVSFNPPDRTERAHVADLVRSMRKDSGFLVEAPIILDYDNFIADGHRRWTAAKIVGIELVPYMRTNKSASKMWAALNSNRRPCGTSTIYKAFAGGMTEIPDGAPGNNLRYVLRKYGPDMVYFLSDNGMTKSAVEWAERVTRYIGWSESDTPIVIDWIVKNRMVRLSRHAIDGGYNRQKFEQLILNGEPLQLFK